MGWSTKNPNEVINTALSSIKNKGTHEIIPFLSNQDYTPLHFGF